MKFAALLFMSIMVGVFGDGGAFLGYILGLTVSAYLFSPEPV